ncbi:hypothetical protein BCR33DRAFT_722530 [Rhizoclosmatium globosum]|uniref:G-protein coupled receptors family 1 profile domain-containing protein n=1 Tax=Rhizoclosmatium globosum TaxID=329046 RepID=A0A1Y2BK87_9FUNG|nr:hypothetical protein BCR33DRAFT_722530 [Rhizoclosmatium globosum]|eukprot:ORY35182.1 hypothetical protein BCR33DRAFT_722530 [Rhizoclosmatium globosum]
MPDLNPLAIIQYFFEVPLFVAGLLLNGLIVALLVHKSKSAVSASRLNTLLCCLSGLSGFWCLFNLVISVCSLVSESPTEALLKLIGCVTASWIQLSLWLNLILALERYIHVCGSWGLWLDRLLFGTVLALCTTSITVTVWAYATTSFGSSLMIFIWSQLILSVYFTTCIGAIILYTRTYFYAIKKVGQYLQNTAGDQSASISVKRTILKNSILMTTSFIVSFTPLIALLTWTNQFTTYEYLSIRPDSYYAVYGFMNLLNALDPIITALIVIYFVPDLKREISNRLCCGQRKHGKPESEEESFASAT